jgi:large subunit ribosomal protein L18
MKRIGRLLRHRRITKKTRGTQERPRLVVFRSKKHIYAQIVNDSAHKVLLGCSTLSKEFKTKGIGSANTEAAKHVGQLIASKALEKGIKAISFDRGGYKYHGRIKSLAEGAREGGLKF